MSKPNILLVMADQHRADILGCNGDPVVHTPNLDRIAAEGTNFTNVHCQGPLCMPARASFLTERYVRDHGVFQNHVDPPRDLPTFLQSLQTEGYHTGCIGKMHLWVHGVGNNSNPVTNTQDRLDQMIGYGFDEPIETVGKLATVGIKSEYSKFLYDRGLYTTYQEFVAERMYAHQNAGAKLPNWAADPIPLPADAYIDAWHGDRAAQWIQDYDRDEPWFMWVGFPGPHDPWDAPTDRYADVDMPMPTSLRRPDVPTDNSPFAQFLDFFLWHHSDSKTFTDERIQATRRAYYANVSIIDEAVGKMLTALDETNQLDNTWVIYTSDHGEMMGEHRMLMKMVFYDQSTRVPLLVRAPEGASPQDTIDALTEHMDLSATVRAIAGAGGHNSFEGRSLLPALQGTGPGPEREVVFSENYGFAMARTDLHKLVFHEDSLAAGQLFDLEADPTEDVNLVEEQPEVVEELLEAHVRPFLANGRFTPDDYAGIFG